MAATICIPKHIICSTFVPDFTPGPTKCVLQTFDERKARASAGNSHFRSLDVGADEDNVVVSVDWIAAGGSVTIVDSEVATVRLTISKGASTEIFSACQIFQSGDVWDVDGRLELASQVNASSALISMNKCDLETSFALSGSSGGSNAFQNFFASANLSGGDGGPTTIPTSSIRTGPFQAMIFINDSELSNSIGNLVETLETREWRNVIGGSANEFDWLAKQDPVEGSTCFNPEAIAASAGGTSAFCATGL
jgi:hypothetical protein